MSEKFFSVRIVVEEIVKEDLVKLTVYDHEQVIPKKDFKLLIKKIIKDVSYYLHDIYQIDYFDV